MFFRVNFCKQHNDWKRVLLCQVINSGEWSNRASIVTVASSAQPYTLSYVLTCSQMLTLKWAHKYVQSRIQKNMYETVSRGFTAEMVFASKAYFDLNVKTFVHFFSLHGPILNLRFFSKLSNVNKNYRAVLVLRLALFLHYFDMPSSDQAMQTLLAYGLLDILTQPSKNKNKGKKNPAPSVARQPAAAPPVCVSPLISQLNFLFSIYVPAFADRWKLKP